MLMNSGSSALDLESYGYNLGNQRTQQVFTAGNFVKAMEGQAEDLDVEVNGVASQIAFRPAPATVLDEETGKGGQSKIARLPWDELEASLLKQWN